MEAEKFIEEIMKLNGQKEDEVWKRYYISYINGEKDYEFCKGYFSGIIDAARMNGKISVIKANTMVTDMFEVLHENHPYWAIPII